MTKYEYLQFPIEFLEWAQNLSEASLLGIVLSLVGIGVLMYMVRARRTEAVVTETTQTAQTDNAENKFAINNFIHADPLTTISMQIIEQETSVNKGINETILLGTALVTDY